MITLLYRHHKKATPSHKLTSLYIIDAIARGARSQYKKEGKSKAPESTASTTPKDETPAGGGSGTCGTFLKKLEGLLGKIVLDVWENAPVEHRVRFPTSSFSSPSRSNSLGPLFDLSQEKVRKVLDIWTKAGTFNSTALARLGTKLLASTTSAPSSSGQGKGSPLAPAMSPTGPSLSPGKIGFQYLAIKLHSSPLPPNVRLFALALSEYRLDPTEPTIPYSKGSTTLLVFLDLDKVVVAMKNPLSFSSKKTLRNGTPHSFSHSSAPSESQKIMYAESFCFSCFPPFTSTVSTDSFDFSGHPDSRQRSRLASIDPICRTE